MALTDTATIQKVNFEAIPDELKQVPQWIVWRSEYDEKKQEYKKMPYQINGKYHASTTKASTWTTFEKIQQAYRTGKFDGIGFVFTDNDDFVGIDLDNEDINNLSLIASSIARIKTYAELSPSGQGIHVIMKGKLPEGVNNRVAENGITKREIYHSGRYFTFTGEVINDHPIMENQKLLDKIVERYYGFKQKKAPSNPVPSQSTNLDDATVIENMLRSKNGDKIQALLQGDISAFTSHSEARQALFNHLAWWTNKDQDQMLRIFNSSKLYRKDKEHDPAIEKAISDTQGGFTFNNSNDSLSDFQLHVQSDNWRNKLDRNDNGSIKSTRKNIKLIMDNDPKLKDIGRTNVFSGHKEIYNKPFWRKSDDINTLWSDADEEQLRNYLDINYGISSAEKTNDVLGGMFYTNSYHPIKDYLNGLEWDGNKRLDTLFIDYLGAKDYKYTRTITRKILVAAVSRIFNPGIKFDEAVILVGKQGAGKSYVLSRLGGEWFNESINSFKGDDALMKLRDSWIIELAELSAMKSSEVEEVKGFISATVDTYRPKYARNIQRFPRQCVFFGSTNNFEFLKDTTGNRRFLPVNVDPSKRTKNPYEELTDETVGQIWAEAMYYYQQGEKLFIDDAEVQKEALRLQEDHTADDGLKGEIVEYLDKYKKVAICAREIWFECLMNDKQPKRHHVSDINQILRNLDGWEEKRTNFGKYGLQRGFIRSL